LLTISFSLEVHSFSAQGTFLVFKTKEKEREAWYGSKGLIMMTRYASSFLAAAIGISS
jgi:hypothetical protein